jgi:flagellar M-ring protein FliF
METPWSRFTELSVSKQIGIIGSLAFSIVAIIAVIMWGSTPSYRVLYSNLSGEDSGAVMDQLSKQGVEYRLNESTNSILVERDMVYKVRLDMSSLGLLKSSDNLDFFDAGQQMGLSKDMETARLKKMLELELTRSINKLETVRSSRVHIAIPPNSVFTRDRSPVTASVILEVADEVSSEQIKSIVALVSSSIPRLKKENVSVVDTSGNYLSKNDLENTSETNSKIESALEKRVIDIIGSAIGQINVSAKVNVQMEYIKKEKTSETWRPNSGQIRSEEWFENIVIDKNLDKGLVPGALTNQPLKTDVAEKDGDKSSDNKNLKKKDGRYSKNYELDKTISHETNQTPEIKRITAAVIINYKREVDKDNKVSYTARSEEAINELRKIVENTIGYNQGRGDSVVVVSRKFEGMEDFSISGDPEEGEKWWDMPIVYDAGKWFSVILSLLIIVFMVIKPLIANIFRKEEEPEEEESQDEEKPPSEGDMIRAGQKEFEDEMAEVRSIADDDPEIVAQVVKNWIGGDDD